MLSTPDRLPPRAGDDEEASLVYEPTVLSYDAVGDVGEGEGGEEGEAGRSEERKEEVWEKGLDGGKKISEGKWEGSIKG